MPKWRFQEALGFTKLSLSRVVWAANLDWGLT